MSRLKKIFLTYRTRITLYSAFFGFVWFIFAMHWHNYG